MLELCCSAGCLVLLKCAPAIVKDTLQIQASHCCTGSCEQLQETSRTSAMLHVLRVVQGGSCLPSSKGRASALCVRVSAGASDRLRPSWGGLGNLACGSGTLGTRPESASRVGVRFAEMECALYHVRSHKLCPSGSCTDSVVQTCEVRSDCTSSDYPFEMMGCPNVIPEHSLLQQNRGHPDVRPPAVLVWRSRGAHRPSGREDTLRGHDQQHILHGFRHGLGQGLAVAPVALVHDLQTQHRRL